jgi:hypothetical protein
VGDGGACAPGVRAHATRQNETSDGRLTPLASRAAGLRHSVLLESFSDLPLNFDRTLTELSDKLTESWKTGRYGWVKRMAVWRCGVQGEGGARNNFCEEHTGSVLLFGAAYPSVFPFGRGTHESFLFLRGDFLFAARLHGALAFCVEGRGCLVEENNGGAADLKGGVRG